MVLKLKKILCNNIQLKLFSLAFGYIFWYMLGQEHTATIWVTVPIAFFDIPKQYTIESPDTIEMQIAGKRRNLYALDTNVFALHINAQDLKPGPQPIPISPQTLLLPDSIKLLHYYPSNVVAYVHETKTLEIEE